MSFSNAIWDRVTAIKTYEDAQRHFDHTPARRSVHWQDNARPLFHLKYSPAAKPHYRIERLQAGDGTFYYDLVLWDTPLVRYHSPIADGTREVWLRGYSTFTSWAWLAVHGWGGYSSTMPTTGGDRVRLMLNPSKTTQKSTFGDLWSAKLTLDEAHRLIVPRSRHAPVFLRRSSDDDKRQRANIRRKLATLLDIAVLRREVYREDADITHYKGRPFRGTEVPHYVGRTLRECRHFLLSDEDSELPEALVNVLMDITRGCYERLLNSEAFEEKFAWRRQSYGQKRNTSTLDELDENVTDTMLRASVLRYLTDRLVSKGSATAALPQFPGYEHPIPRLTLSTPDKEFSYEDYFNDYPRFPAR